MTNISIIRGIEGIDHNQWDSVKASQLMVDCHSIDEPDEAVIEKINSKPREMGLLIIDYCELLVT